MPTINGVKISFPRLGIVRFEPEHSTDPLNFCELPRNRCQFIYSTVKNSNPEKKDEQTCQLEHASK